MIMKEFQICPRCSFDNTELLDRCINCAAKYWGLLELFAFSTAKYYIEIYKDSTEIHYKTLIFIVKTQLSPKITEEQIDKYILLL